LTSAASAALPLPSGRGRPRTRCEVCAPSEKRPPARQLKVTSGKGVVAATLSELEAADAVDSSAGQAALTIAAAIASGDERGAALAALVKQLGATLTSATSHAEPEADPIQALRDELAARREHRGA